jgi:hypothetical protein
MMGMKWPKSKDPEAVRDYGVDWTADIGDATITGASFAIVGSSTCTVEGSSFEDKTATVRLSGGADGEVCEVVNHIIMDTGEEDEVTCILTIKEQ